MFTALTLSMVLAAPVPAPVAPVPAGTAPRLMELKPDANGKIIVQIIRTEMEKVPVAVGGAVKPGGGAPAIVEREVTVTKHMTVELGDVKDLAITTADGKKLEKEEAMKKLAGGAIVIVSGDGKPVSPAFLKVFKDDTLVLASPEMVGQQFPPAIGRPGLRPVPLPVNPGGIQIQPGVIQLQIQPGNVQILPAPVAPPAVVPAPGGAAPAVLPAAPLVPAVPAVPAKPVVPAKPEK